VGTGNGNVTFQVQLPAELGSRAYFGNGTQAKNLYVAVYDANGNVLDKLTNFNGETPAAGMTVNNFTTSLSTTVTIPLVKGQTYTVVFWADSYAPVEEGAEFTSPFTFTPADASMKVDYTKFVGNSDAPDAFFAAVTVPADGTTHKVELKRPFAQINIGTDDRMSSFTPWRSHWTATSSTCCTASRRSSRSSKAGLWAHVPSTRGLWTRNRA
jgi:hypothetical protein